MAQENMLVTIMLLYQKTMLFGAAMLQFQDGQAEEILEQLQNHRTVAVTSLCLEDGGEQAMEYIQNWLSQKAGIDVTCYSISTVGYYLLE